MVFFSRISFSPYTVKVARRFRLPRLGDFCRQDRKKKGISSQPLSLPFMRALIALKRLFQVSQKGRVMCEGFEGPGEKEERIANQSPKVERDEKPVSLAPLGEASI